MNYLLVGGSSKLAINYINECVGRSTINFICIDNVEIDKEITVDQEVNIYFKYIKTELNKENINKIMNEYPIDRVINFHELREYGHDTIEYTKNNYDFVVDLHDCCVKNKVKHFTQISTANVYGNSSTLRVESDPLKMTDDYIVSKINSELYLLNQTDIPAVVLRVSEVFGNVLKDHYLDRIIKNILNDEEIIIKEDSEFIRTYIDVQDCIYFIDTSSRQKIEGAYNVCSNLHLSSKDILDTIINEFNYTKEVVYTNEKPLNLTSVKVESNSISKLLSYSLTRQELKYKYYIERLKQKYIQMKKQG
ncbi:MAG: NAD-dependent epimerase/dehydratase family protein [bacterium]